MGFVRSACFLSAHAICILALSTNDARAQDKTGGTRAQSPAESMARMRIRDGLRIELVAAEPLVVDPVAIDFGPDGKLWVAEMRDYPEGMDGKYRAGGKIKYLEDVNGDGTYDTSTEFMSGVPFPTGLMAWRRGVLVCAAPDVIYAEDTNVDGKADFQKKLISGFETENFQARVNGLSLGLDNWIYVSAGLFGGDGVLPSGKSVNIRNRDFRWLVDKEVIEPVAGRTQQSRVRDDWGNWFGCDSGTPLYHYPVVESYLARNRYVVSPNPMLGVVSGNELFPLGAIVSFALSGPPGRPTSACGLGIYRDTRLGEAFYGDAFICEPVNQLVHRMKLTQAGAGFTGSRAPGEEQSEFLSSTDNWFRPVQARTGPDGALWVVDMYRYMIEHPRFVAPEVRAQLDVRAGDSLGRIYRIVPENDATPRTPDLTKLDAVALVEVLKSSNGTLRDMAHLELLWRADQRALEPLRKLALTAELPQSRVQALGALEGLQGLTPEIVQQGLADAHPGVRRQAVRLSEPFLADSPELLSSLQAMLSEPDSFVRQQLAYSLGASKAPVVGESLAKILEASGDDPYIASAALSSLNEQNVAIALTAVHRNSANREIVNDVFQVAAAMSEGEGLDDALNEIFAPREGAHDAWQFMAMRGVMETRARRQGKLDEARVAAFSEMVAEARKLVADDAADESLRIAAAGILPFAREPESNGDLAALNVWLSPQSSPSLQSAGISVLAEIDTPAAAAVMVDGFRQLGPAMQTSLLDAALAREHATAALLTAMEAGEIAAGQIDAARRQALLAHRNTELQARAARLLMRTSGGELAAVLQTYQSADVTQGDIARGKAVFAKKCSVCHVLDGAGHAVGPDLAALTDKSKEYLVASILHPNDAIDQRYATYTAVTTGGEVLNGLLAAEVGNSLTLKMQEGKERTILRGEMEALQNTGKSLMPEGLEKELSLAAMTDLLAYLGAATARAPQHDAGPSADVAPRVRAPATDTACVQAIAALLVDVKIGTDDEYRVIPQLFGEAIAAGKRNEAAELTALLDFALPKEDEPLRDWQAVAIGGGVINGITQAGGWPAQKVSALLVDEPALLTRWQRALTLAATMADDESICAGTRYDALRMTAMRPFEQCRDQLTKYLALAEQPNLQQGAVSGLADLPRADAVALLLGAVPNLRPELRTFAIHGAVRTDEGIVKTLEMLEAGQIAPDHLTNDARDRLLKYTREDISARAAKMLQP